MGNIPYSGVWTLRQSQVTVRRLVLRRTVELKRPV